MLKVMAGILLASITSLVAADGHGEATNRAVAMQVHYCTLNAGKDMADVDKALGAWRKWKEQHSYNGWTAELTPQYDTREGYYDFYWLNFMPFTEMAGVLEEWASSGAASQRAIEGVAECKVGLFGSRLKFPQIDESKLNSTSVVLIDYCHRKDGVDMETLLSQHDEFVSTSEAADADYIWNVVWPIAGIPSTSVTTGAQRMDFAHMFWFPTLASQMAAFESEVNGDLRMERKTYLQSFADCKDRNTFNVNILNTPNRAWN